MEIYATQTSARNACRDSALPRSSPPMHGTSTGLRNNASAPIYRQVGFLAPDYFSPTPKSEMPELGNLPADDPPTNDTERVRRSGELQLELASRRASYWCTRSVTSLMPMPIPMPVAHTVLYRTIIRLSAMAGNSDTLCC